MSEHCQHCTDSCDRVDLTEQQWTMQLGAAWRGGQSYEREAIVAWLRSFIDPYGEVHLDLDDLALIESGEHLRGDDEA